MLMRTPTLLPQGLEADEKMRLSAPAQMRLSAPAREQIKNLKELVEKKDALIETMRKEHYDAEEHARAVVEEKIEKVGELQEQLDKVEAEKEKVAKNCFEQMSKLNTELQKTKELEAEKEAME